MTALQSDLRRGRRGRIAGAAGLALALLVFAPQPSGAAETGPVTIAVFDFELVDNSAGGGVVEPDPIDLENLKKSADEARRLLADSGRFSIVDAGSAAEKVSAAGGVQYCKGCEAPLAKALGADQSMIGVITRVSRTEYTLQLLVRDSGTGEILANDFTGLRMGANYSWPRSVKSLLNKGILAAQPAE